MFLMILASSSNITVGYKIPTAEVLSRIDPGRTPPRLLREPSPVANIDYRTTPPGLLREPGSVVSFNYR